MKTAYIAWVGFGTRVILEEGATDEQIIAAAIPQLIERLKEDTSVFDEVGEDVDCPYDPIDDLQK